MLYITSSLPLFLSIAKYSLHDNFSITRVKCPPIFGHGIKFTTKIDKGRYYGKEERKRMRCSPIFGQYCNFIVSLTIADPILL